MNRRFKSKLWQHGFYLGNKHTKTATIILCCCVVFHKCGKNYQNFYWNQNIIKIQKQTKLMKLPCVLISNCGHTTLQSSIRGCCSTFSASCFPDLVTFQCKNDRNMHKSRMQMRRMRGEMCGRRTIKKQQRKEEDLHVHKPEKLIWIN